VGCRLATWVIRGRRRPRRNGPGSQIVAARPPRLRAVAATAMRRGVATAALSLGLRAAITVAARWAVAASAAQASTAMAGALAAAERTALEASSRGAASHGARPYVPGARVQLHGLHEAAELNGRQGILRGFDRRSGRYMVTLVGSDQTMKLQPRNMWRLPEPSPMALQPAQLLSRPYPQLQARQAHHGQSQRGRLVIIHGLVSAKSLNGQVGRLEAYDRASERYVVKLRAGATRKIRPANLRLLGALPHSRVCQHWVAAGGDLGAGVAGSEPAERGSELATMADHRGGGRKQRKLCFNARHRLPALAPPHRASPEAAVELATVAAPPLAVAAQGRTAGSAHSALGAAQASVRPEETLQAGRIGRWHWPVGAHVRLQGLRTAAELNGQLALVRGFDRASQRYAVQLRDGELRRVAGAHLAPLLPATALAASAPAGSWPRLSVCNAFAVTSPVQLVAIVNATSVRGGHKYVSVAPNLAFQACIDIPELPNATVGLAFLVARLQVARLTLNETLQRDPWRGLELTIFRSSADSMKASVRQSRVSFRDPAAYYLHVVNGYVGQRLLDIRVQRGSYDKSLVMDRTYRLSREEPIRLTLTDGFQQLHLSFQPRRSRTYCIVTTGVDIGGLQGDVRPMGLLAHEVGAWTASEELGRQSQGLGRGFQRRGLALAQVSDGTKGQLEEGTGQGLGLRLTRWFSDLVGPLRQLS